MDIQRAKEEIKHSIRAYLDKDEFGDYRIPAIRQRPMLLMGPPGIGKTQIMEQIASECDLALVSYTITHHTRQSAIGLPFIQEKVYNGKKRSVTEYTMSEIIASVYDRMEESGKNEGILFIDEINCVSETLAPTMLQFLQGKSFGNQKVPQGWIIVAAGNPPEYNKSVREFDVVTLDRVKVIDVEANYMIWKEYAYAAGIHGAVISYLDIHKENFYRMETTVDGKQFVTARGWEDLSEMIYAYERLNMTMDREVVIQYLQHPRVAKDFANYLSLYYKYRSDYRIDEILSGTIREGTLNKLKWAQFDEHIEVVGLILTRLAENFRAVWEKQQFTDRLFDVLKTFKMQLDSQDESLLAQTPEVLMKALLEQEQDLVKTRTASGQNEKQIRHESRALLAALEKDAALLNGYVGERTEAFDIVRGEFAAETQQLEELTAKASEQLEYAFDFMEAAFGESQEMVVFITELSVNRYAVAFLQENESDRYYMYNKRMLIEDRERIVKEKLDALKDDQIW